MTEKISPKQFREAEGVEDWRVLGDGANAYFRTGSLAAGARLLQAVGGLPGRGDLPPDVDVRHGEVTVRMVPGLAGYGGMPHNRLQPAGTIPGAPRHMGCSA